MRASTRRRAAASTYTPELVDGLRAGCGDRCRSRSWCWSTRPPSGSSWSAALGRRILARQGHPATLTTTTDLDAGVDGADAVLLQLRVGGQAARQRDETWPLECGCVGQETTGAGGLAKALRTVPVVLDIAERVRAAATRTPGSSTSPTRSASSPAPCSRQGHRAVGLCNVAIGFQRRFAGVLGVEPDGVELDHVGLNHLTWERAARVRRRGPCCPSCWPATATRSPTTSSCPARCSQQLGVVPSYYLRYFYAHDEVVREQLAEPTRARPRWPRSSASCSRCTPTRRSTRSRRCSTQRGGAYYSEAAVAAGRVPCSATARDRRPSRWSTLRNDGTLPFLPDDAVIEVPARVDRARRPAAAGRAARPAVRRADRGT